MQIDKKVLEKIIDPRALEADAHVSIFIVSAKSPRLKKLGLDSHLSPERRAEKLHKWAQEHRLVAVIETSDQVFAHANGKYVEQLNNQQDLSINGKKVSVKALSDEDYDQLSMVGAAFEEYVLQNSEKKEIDEEDSHENVLATHPAIRQFFSANRLVSDLMQKDYVIARMKNFSDQIILNILKQISESRRELDRQKREDEKIADIKDKELKKEILKFEILSEEIKRQTLRQDLIPEDIKRVNLAHGIEPDA